jgi:hypothetical protein
MRLKEKSLNAGKRRSEDEGTRLHKVDPIETPLFCSIFIYKNRTTLFGVKPYTYTEQNTYGKEHRNSPIYVALKELGLNFPSRMWSNRILSPFTLQPMRCVLSFEIIYR